MAKYILNPYTGKFDAVDSTDELATYDARYLKLSQSTPQRVINDAPHFDGGIKIKAGQKLIFDSD